MNAPPIAPGDEITVNYNAESPLGFMVIMDAALEQQPECPEAHPRCNDEAADGNPHRNLSPVDPDLPAEGETEGVEQSGQSEHDA
jgi:hypothetical protein